MSILISRMVVIRLVKKLVGLNVRLKTGVAAALVAVLLVAVAANAYAHPQPLAARGVARVLDMLERGVDRAERLASDAGALEQVEDRLSEVRQLISDARALLSDGQPRAAWQKAREAMRVLREVFRDIPVPSSELRERILGALLRRAEGLVQRLERLAKNSRDEEVRTAASEAAERLRTIVEEARQLLDAGDLDGTAEKLREASRIILDFNAWLREYARQRHAERLDEAVERLRRRLAVLEQALEEQAENPDAAEALNDVRHAVELLNQADELLGQGQIWRAQHLLRRALQIASGLREITPA